MWYIYITEYASWKEWNNANCRNRDGPKDYHTKQSKPERERQIPYDITYMWEQNMTQMNLCMKQKETHRHREHSCGCQGGGGVGGWWTESIGLVNANYYI